MTRRIAFVMPGVGVIERGAEAFVVELCTALHRRAGLDVTVLSRAPVAGAVFQQGRLRVVPRDARWLTRLYGATRLGRKALDTVFLDPLNVEWSSAALSSFPILRRHRFDLVVMEGGLVGSWLCRYLRSSRGTPFIDIAHGNSPKWEGAFARQRPDRVVAFTEAGADMIRQRAPKARVDVIPHGIDLEHFREDLAPVAIELEHPIILTVGAVDEHKRMLLAVEAVARLGRGSILVLGDGPAAASLDSVARGLLGPARYLRTTVPRHEIPRWYRAADVFTLPSVTESFGLVYLEAMACGLCCVATDDPVRREVLGRAGEVCDPCDIDAYATAIDRVLQQEPSEVPRRQAERFPIQRTVDAYAGLIDELVPGDDV